MRCSKCGAKIKKKSSFCIKCGTKIPPKVKGDKKSKKDKKGKKKKISKIKILIPLIIVLILGLFSFLVFGGNMVPEKIRELKAYTYVTGIIKGKLPDKIELPFDLPKIPFDFSFDLPNIPNPADLLGDSEVPKKEKIMEDLAAFEGEEEGKPSFDSLEIEKRITIEEEKKDTVYVITQTSSLEGEGESAAATTAYYQLIYKKHFIGGWKLEEAKPYNVEGSKASVVGISNKTVIKDENLFADIPADWKSSNVKVIEHYTDIKAGTDTVVVYMELVNDYVAMTGTKELTYQYNEKSGKWESAGPASKLTCLSIEPVEGQGQTQETEPEADQTHTEE